MLKMAVFFISCSIDLQLRQKNYLQCEHINSNGTNTVNMLITAGSIILFGQDTESIGTQHLRFTTSLRYFLRYFTYILVISADLGNKRNDLVFIKVSIGRRTRRINWLILLANLRPIHITIPSRKMLITHTAI